MMKIKNLTLFFCLIASPIFAQTSLLEKEMGSYINSETITAENDENASINDLSLSLDHRNNIYASFGVTSLEAENISILTDVTQSNYGGGENDAYIEKRSPEGELLWNTFIGGEKQDGIIGVKINSTGIYIIGYTYSNTNISTPEAFIENFVDYNADPNNISPIPFILKLNAEGSKEWGTYFRTTAEDVGETLTDFTIDNNGNLYLVGFTQSTENVSTAGAFDESLGEATHKGFIQKFDTNGNRIWGTYHGSSSYLDVSTLGNIALDQNGNIVVGGFYLGNTASYFLTSATYDDGQNLPNDVFLAKFDPDGERIWGLMYGGINLEQSIDVAVDSENNILWFGTTKSEEDIASQGAYQEVLGSSNPVNNTDDAFLAKFDEDGNQLWSTYYGGQLIDSYQSQAGGGYSFIGFNKNLISFDEDDNIYFASLTKSTNQIATPNTFQDELASVGNFDSYVVKFNPAGERLWGTYFGGLGDDKTSGLLYAGNDEFYLYGATSSTEGIATSNAWYDQELESDVSGFIVKFIPNTLGITEKTNTAFSVWPNPTKGAFTISGKANQLLQVSIYDVHGRKVRDIAHVKVNSPVVLQRKLSTGIYFLNINAEENQVQNLKLIVN
ncbi:T9SS type A sorting domain-containing protein [Mesonia sp.]|uniref:T9SS type A sorting domain-containing protein n=2 Tax=Mesonia sp. TaxID=1960830 RepID=UPI003F9DDE07